MTKTLEEVPFDLSGKALDTTLGALQGWLPPLIGVALRLKQAHWNLHGLRFKSVHEQLDEILADVRAAVDDVAERIVTLGGAADGLPATVAEHAVFDTFPAGRLGVENAIEIVCDDLARVVQHGRKAIEKLGGQDPISEDLAIGIVGALEKHHWMLRSQREL
ncbi:MAG: DNA starvation/stationary phase protection protein [Planctomycetes bacterium]|nr:DNA starvation/stationary phase protection protein [Planctomycetota bacterium]